MSEDGAIEEASTEETYCYGHPTTPTRLRCTRCDRPICGRCAIPASVGQHCPECVAEARRGAPRVRSAMAATAPAVTTIIAINVVVYVSQLILPAITDRFAAQALAINAGEYHRLFTSMFLHSPQLILHILLNMYVLYSFGPNVEKAFGTARFVVMYLIAGFAGGAVSYAFGSCLTSSVGASGAIFGVVGILAAYLYNRRTSAIANAYLRQIGIFVAINVALGFAVANIDYLAHLGGLGAGVALGLGFDRAERTRAPGVTQLWTSFGILALMVALIAWKTSNFVESCEALLR